MWAGERAGVSGARPVAGQAVAGRRRRWRRLLRYVLIWPVIAGYRRRVRRSLRWRLAGSHLSTVFLSILTVSVVGAIVLVATSFIQRPAEQEPGYDAKAVADLLVQMGWQTTLSTPRTSALLEAIATGQVGPNMYSSNMTFSASVGKQFAHIRSLSVVNQSLRVIASSDPTLVHRMVLLVGPAAAGVAQRALDGSTNTLHNSVVRPGTLYIAGAYPIRASDGHVIATVVVDKAKRSFPTGWGMVLLALEYVGGFALGIGLIVGLGAVPVATIVGVRRARAISQPVARLAVAAETIAAGDLHARVVVRGEDEIAAFGRSFNQMADKLQVSMEQEAAHRSQAETLLAANRDLIANVSHELRTPVSLVRGHLEALSREPERCDEYTRIALRETDRLERLVEDLFHLTRVESQGITLEREPFDAGSAAREAVESLAEPARREAGITMQAEVARGDLTCVGDRARLVQVLQNLIRNAIRFTPEGGIILVGARAAGDVVTVTVRDTGVGIAPQDLPRVFDRFYRAEQSRNRSGGGAGLGLAIARQLVEAMGGTIGVESELDEGSIFTIRLPRGSAPAARQPDAAATTDAPQSLAARPI